MFTPTVVYPRETQNVTFIDDADMSWPVLPGDFPALDAEVVPYINKAFHGEVFHQTLTAITLPLNFSYTFTGTFTLSHDGQAADYVIDVHRQSPRRVVWCRVPSP